MIAQKCMHIDSTDARKKWKMMQFVMSQDKSITLLEAGLQLRFRQSSGII